MSELCEHVMIMDPTEVLLATTPLYKFSVNG
jgi:hypothetical protein